MYGYESAFLAGVNGLNLAISFAAAMSASKSRAPTRFVIGLIAAVSADALIALTFVAAYFIWIVWNGDLTLYDAITGTALFSTYAAVILITTGGVGTLTGAVLGTSTAPRRKSVPKGV